MFTLFWKFQHNNGNGENKIQRNKVFRPHFHIVILCDYVISCIFLMEGCGGLVWYASPYEGG